MPNLAEWTFLDAAYRRGGGLAADLCFRGPARRAARPCSARRSDAHGARDQFASFRGGCSPARDGREPYCKWGNRNRICTGRSNIRPRSGGIGRLRCLTAELRRRERAWIASASEPTRGKRKIGIYGSTNVSPI